MRIAALIAAAALSGCLGTTEDAATVAPMGVDFAWTEADRCATASPAFTVSGVPAGTATLRFRMKDLDVPTYNHGGGSVDWSGQDGVPQGAFNYKGPCPPSGAHDYEWTVEAIDASGGTVIGRGKAVRAFPPS